MYGPVVLLLLFAGAAVVFAAIEIANEWLDNRKEASN